MTLVPVEAARPPAYFMNAARPPAFYIYAVDRSSVPAECVAKALRAQQVSTNRAARKQLAAGISVVRAVRARNEPKLLDLLELARMAGARPVLLIGAVSAKRVAPCFPEVRVIAQDVIAARLGDVTLTVGDDSTTVSGQIGTAIAEVLAAVEAPSTPPAAEELPPAAMALQSAANALRLLIPHLVASDSATVPLGEAKLHVRLNPEPVTAVTPITIVHLKKASAKTASLQAQRVAALQRALTRNGTGDGQIVLVFRDGVMAMVRGVAPDLEAMVEMARVAPRGLVQGSLVIGSDCCLSIRDRRTERLVP